MCQELRESGECGRAQTPGDLGGWAFSPRKFHTLTPGAFNLSMSEGFLGVCGGVWGFGVGKHSQIHLLKIILAAFEEVTGGRGGPV